jgi:hypothetical protein
MEAIPISVLAEDIRDQLQAALDRADTREKAMQAQYGAAWQPTHIEQPETRS